MRMKHRIVEENEIIMGDIRETNGNTKCKRRNKNSKIRH